MAYECPKPQLQIFEPKGYQYSILEKNRVELKPIGSLENSRTISFLDQGYGESYRDLSSVYIQLKVKLIKGAAPQQQNVSRAGRSIDEPERKRRKTPDAAVFLGEAYRAPQDDETHANTENENDNGNHQANAGGPTNKPLLLGKNVNQINTFPFKNLSRNSGLDERNENDDSILGDSTTPVVPANNEIKTSVVNNFMHSLFNQVILTLNNRQIRQNSPNYGYRAYLENLLNFDREAAP